MIIFILKVLNILCEVSKLSNLNSLKPMWYLLYFRRNAEVPHFFFPEYNFPSIPAYCLSCRRGSCGSVVTNVLHIQNTDDTIQVLFTSAVKMYYEFVPDVSNLQ